MLFCAANKPYWCWIDPKRMNRLEVNAQNMYATVEPYVTHAQLSVEARKVGLINGVPAVGSQTAVLASHVAIGTHMSSYRTGRAARNLLGTESVLPNGQILRTGSLATSDDDWSWGEGPGPDLRGFLRGQIGHLGSMGIVTKIAVKLYPWPGPSVMPTEGEAPLKTCLLPKDKARFFLIRYKDANVGLQAMQKICKAELGRYLTLQLPSFLADTIAVSREEWNKNFANGYWDNHFKYTVVVGLVGVASPRQLDYEEAVLRQIVEETGGVYVDQDVFDNWNAYVAANMVVCPLGARGERVAKGFPPKAIGGNIYDSLTGMAEFIPQDEDLFGWVGPMDLGHFAFCDIRSEMGPGERSDRQDKLMIPRAGEEWAENMKRKLSPAGVLGGNVAQMYPAFGSNVHMIVAEIKEAYDPQNLANPPRTVNMDAIAKMKAAAREARN